MGNGDALSLFLGSGGSKAIVAWAAVLCRVGGCLMTAPGFSASQVMIALRLWIAVAASLAVTPVCLDWETIVAVDVNVISTARLLCGELAVGFLIGALGRAFIAGLETLMTGAAAMIGLANPFGIAVDHNEIMAPVASFVVLTATVLIFLTDLHGELIRGLVESYRIVSFGGDFDTAAALSRLVDVTRDAFIVALRVCAPFVVYSIVINVSTSLINRMSPQIAIYLIAMPFSIAGGLFVLYFTFKPMLTSVIGSLGRVVLLD